jgi:hypothetical protein
MVVDVEMDPMFRAEVSVDFYRIAIRFKGNRQSISDRYTLDS